MAITRHELAERVAQKLGVLSVGDALSAEDFEVISARADSVRDQLDVMKIVQVDLDSGIRDTYASHFIDATAAQLVDEYGIPEPRRSQIRSEGLLGLNPMSPAERWLRKATTRLTTGAPVVTEYF